MGYRIVYEGRPSGGLAIMLVYGILMLFAGMVVMASIFQIGIDGWQLPLGAAIFLGFAGFFLFNALRGASLKRLVIENRAISYFSGRRLVWEVAWGDIVGLKSTCSQSTQHHFSGILIVTSTGRHELTNADTFVEKKLRNVFRELARRGSGQNIRMADGNGWATDLDLQFAPWEGDAPVDIAEYLGVWHFSPDRFPILRYGFQCALVFSLLTLLALFSGSSSSLYLGFFGGAIMLPVLFGLIFLDQFHAIYFDESGITYIRNSGRRVEIPWDRVVSYSYGGNIMNIRTRYWASTGLFEPGVADALRQMFARTRLAGPAEPEGPFVEQQG